MSTHRGNGKVDFSGLILGFSSAALGYLGYSNEGSPSGPKSLELARQNIDIIEMLMEKCEGNLSSEESELVRGVLNDLKFKFAECSK